MTEDDPRARFRELPERVRPEDTVETSDADPPLVVESEPAEVWRTALFGPGTP
jgi:hypothetical protein